MSRRWMCSYIQSGLRFARRNSTKIAIFTVAAGTAVVVTTYMRRQLAAVNESLAFERAEGARKLRAVFVGNMQAVRATFRALLPVTASVLGNVRAVDSSEYLAALREKPDLAERGRLFEKLRVASVARLTSAVYIVSVLYCVLSLQMNLIARYFNANLDAPVQALPSGLLSDMTSKRFLDVARNRFLDQRCVDAIVRHIEAVVRVHAQEIGLTERVGLADVKGLFTNILRNVGTINVNFDSAGSRGSNSEANDDNSPKPLQQWLFGGGVNECEEGGEKREDANYEWLLAESLDLCEVLDFNKVIQSTTEEVLAYVLLELKKIMFANEDGSENQRPFAHFFARFEGVASSLFKVSDSCEDESDVTSSSRGLEQALSEAQDCARFSASVFLSGEKENERQETDGTTVELGVDQAQSRNQLMSNVPSLSGGVEARNDLGLMFDVQ